MKNKIWKKIVRVAADYINGGRRGIGETTDVSYMGGDEPYADPWVDAAHQPIPIAAKWPKNKPGTVKVMEEAGYTKDMIPGMNVTPSVFEAHVKEAVDGGFPLTDTVRDVSPTDNWAPAPDNAIADGAKPSGWVHAGDNGIEVVPSPLNNDGGMISDIIRGYQLVKFIPNPPHDVNKIGSFRRVGQWNAEDPTEGAVPELQSTLALHLVKDHLVPPQQIMAMPDEDTANQLHMFLHQQGQNTHNPEVQIVANILDPVQPGLDPSVFDDAESESPRLKDEIATWVEDKVREVFQTSGYDDTYSWLKLVLTGSLTTLQWSPESDFDISLWVDLDNFGEFDRAEIVKLVIDKLDGTLVPGTQHPLQCFVVNVEEVHGLSDIYMPGIRSAWDIDNSKWIVPPESSRVHDVKQEYPDDYHRALQVASKMKSLLDYQPNRAEVYWHYLHGQRRRAMKAGRGDFSPENITYKMLSNSNLFPRIEQITGEHIAYKVSSFEDGDITYYNIKAYLPSYVKMAKTANSLEDYEIDKLHVDEGEIGEFSWVDTGYVVESEGVEVHPDFRRRGIASAMIRAAKEMTPNLVASSYRTTDGDLFLSATHILPDPEEINIIRLEPRYAQSPLGRDRAWICPTCSQTVPIEETDHICEIDDEVATIQRELDSGSIETTLDKRIENAAGDEINEFK